ncbi:MAG: EF-hand domain-containing protein [Burkholderiales bacterium]
MKLARIFAATLFVASWSPAFGGDLIVPEYSKDGGVAPVPAASYFSEREWQRLDVNKNGFVTKREARTMDPGSWTYADLNADGEISRKEWDAVSSMANKQGFNRAGRDEWRSMDLNADGFVTRGEALLLDNQTFTRLDVDGDGRLSQKEWSGALVSPGAAGRAAPSPPPFRKFE